MANGVGNEDSTEYKAPLAKPSLVEQSSRDEAARFLQAEIAKETARANGLAKDLVALRSEYIAASDDEAPEKLKKNIRARMSAALETVDELLVNGNDGVRAGLAKWIIDRGLAPDSMGGESANDKKFNKLLEELKAND